MLDSKAVFSDLSLKVRRLLQLLIALEYPIENPCCLLWLTKVCTKRHSSIQRSVCRRRRQRRRHTGHSWFRFRFTFLDLQGVTSTYCLQASSPPLLAATSRAIKLVHGTLNTVDSGPQCIGPLQMLPFESHGGLLTGPSATLRLIKSPKPSVVVAERFDLCFQIYDAINNVASGDNTTIVEVELLSNSNAQLLGITRRRALQGQVCFPDLFVENVFSTAQIVARAEIADVQTTVLTTNFSATSQLQLHTIVITSSPPAVLRAVDSVSISFELFDSLGNYLDLPVPVDIALMQPLPPKPSQAEADLSYVEMNHLLSGSKRVLAVGGRGQFASLSVRQAGSSYLLTISSPLLQAVTLQTSHFMIEAAAAVATQIITPPPLEVEAGVSFKPSLVVQVRAYHLPLPGLLGSNTLAYTWLICILCALTCHECR